MKKRNGDDDETLLMWHFFIRNSRTIYDYTLFFSVSNLEKETKRIVTNIGFMIETNALRSMAWHDVLVRV